MEPHRLQRLRDVSVPHVSGRSDTETDRGQQRAASPAASKHRQQADDLKAVSRDETPPVECTPMLGSVIIKKLGERIRHASTLEPDCRLTLRFAAPRRATRKGRSDVSITRVVR
jgi:hypothetical protein